MARTWRAGNLTSTTDRNGRVRNVSYDALNRQTGQTWVVNGTTLNTVTLTYDAADHLLTAGEAQGTYTMTYDALNRMATQQGLFGVTLTFTYDAVDNRTQVKDSFGGTTTSAYDALRYATGTGNQLTSDGTWNYTYDNEGNLATKTNIATGEKWTYGYDLNNRMTSAVDANSTGTTLALAYYSYDVVGNRIEKDTWTQAAGTTVTRYAYAPGPGGGQVFATLNSSNQLQTRYVSGDGTNEIVAQVAPGGVVAWYLTDRLGSARDIVSNTGAVQDHLDYDGFGNVTNETAPTFGAIAKFQGMVWDAEVGLYHTWGRQYNPSTGRWTTEDPLGFAAADPNFYRFVRNHAPNAKDPTGLYLVAKDEKDAQKLIDDLKKAGVKNIQAFPLSSGLIYIYISPADAEALVKYADAHWPQVFDDKFKRDPKTRARWKALAQARTKFLLAAGIAGDATAHKVNFNPTDPGNPPKLTTKDSKEIADFRGKQKDKPGRVAIDVGGTGRYTKTNKGELILNVNLEPLSDLPDIKDQPIPNFIYGDGEDLPFANKSVDGIASENTPINRKWILEMLRAIKPGGFIKIYGTVEGMDRVVKICKDVNPRLDIKDTDPRHYLKNGGRGIRIKVPGE